MIIKGSEDLYKQINAINFLNNNCIYVYKCLNRDKSYVIFNTKIISNKRSRLINNIYKDTSTKRISFKMRTQPTN